MTTSKQAILIRKDLKLKRAAVAAMAAKISCEFLVENNISDDGAFKADLTPLEIDWLVGNSTRIVLGVNSEETLRSLLFKAEIAGLSCYSLNGGSDDQMMCAAIGPDDSEKIDEITRNLKLF